MIFENEITIEITCSYEELDKILIEKGFEVVEKYKIVDDYLLPKTSDLTNKNSLEILKEAIIVRNFNDYEKELVYKYKEYNDLGEILKQSKVVCHVNDIDESINFLENIGYKKLIHIENNSICYSNGELSFSVQLVNNKYIFIELEERSKHVETVFSNAEDMKKAIDSLNIPMVKNNYFAKKTVIVLEESKK